jgi:hypothetical protein
MWYGTENGKYAHEAMALGSGNTRTTRVIDYLSNLRQNA